MAAGDGSRKVLVRRKADVSALFLKKPSLFKHCFLPAEEAP